jgi:hypothetical protein
MKTLSDGIEREPVRILARQARLDLESRVVDERGSSPPSLWRDEVLGRGGDDAVDARKVRDFAPRWPSRSTPERAVAEVGDEEASMRVDPLVVEREGVPDSGRSATNERERGRRRRGAGARVRAIARARAWVQGGVLVMTAPTARASAPRLRATHGRTDTTYVHRDDSCPLSGCQLRVAVRWPAPRRRRSGRR